jgi:hypothetical protein
MSAFGGEAASQKAEILKYEGQLTARSGHSDRYDSRNLTGCFRPRADSNCVLANHQIPYVPPTRNIFAGKPKPIKALNDYVIQHAISIVIVTIVTNRCVLRFTKRITAVAAANDKAHRVDSSGDPNWSFRRGW